MKSRALLLGVCVLFTGGCHQHLLTDYRPLHQSGMWSSGLEQLKKLNTSDFEVAQLVKVKQARMSDDTCVALVAAAHERKHPFASGDSTANPRPPRHKSRASESWPIADNATASAILSRSMPWCPFVEQLV